MTDRDEFVCECGTPLGAVRDEPGAPWRVFPCATCAVRMAHARLLSPAQDLARALCLGQRGFGRQGDPLPHIDAARKHCGRLLKLLGEPGPYHYDRPEIVPALVLAFKADLEETLRLGARGFALAGNWFTEKQVREALAWMESKTK